MKVIQLFKRAPEVTALDGTAWHTACAGYMAKYGTDWKYRWGFDLRLLTQAEYDHIMAIYNTLTAARQAEAVADTRTAQQAVDSAFGYIEP